MAGRPLPTANVGVDYEVMESIQKLENDMADL